MFARLRCACGGHEWSAIEPGAIYATNAEWAFICTKWAQLGTKRCLRKGCTTEAQFVREGVHGFEGLIIETNWGCSSLSPEDVKKLPVYDNSHAQRQLVA